MEVCMYVTMWALTVVVKVLEEDIDDEDVQKEASLIKNVK